MSSVPKSKRNTGPNDLEVFKNVYDLRKAIMDWLLIDFGELPPNLPPDLTQLTDRQKFRVEQYENFCQWYRNYMRTAIVNMIRAIINHLTAADSIYPILVCECDVKRLEQDKALACCECLIQEFQFIAETLQVDLNRYTTIVSMIDKEMRLIKGWRQYGNKERERIIEKENKNK